MVRDFGAKERQRRRGIGPQARFVGPARVTAVTAVFQEQHAETVVPVAATGPGPEPRPRVAYPDRDFLLQLR